MIVVAITGSLASGKTQAARILEKKKRAKVFSADEAARRVVRKGQPAYGAILKLFGEGYAKGGQLDRQKLAGRVFSNPEDLKKLNTLVHPYVIFECLSAIQRYKNKPGLLVLDVPLLFESKMEGLADFSIVVTARKEKMIQRAMQKGYPKELARKILAAQWPIAKKAAHADFVVDNNGSAAELEAKLLKAVRQIEQFSEKYRKESARR